MFLIFGTCFVLKFDGNNFAFMAVCQPVKCDFKRGRIVDEIHKIRIGSETEFSFWIAFGKINSVA